MDYKTFEAELERLGLDEVKVQLQTGIIEPGHRRDVAQTWLLRKEAVRDAHARGMQSLATLAAERAVRAAERQATTAERATRIAVAALVVAIAAAILSLVAMVRH